MLSKKEREELRELYHLVDVEQCFGLSDLRRIKQLEMKEAEG